MLCRVENVIFRSCFRKLISSFYPIFGNLNSFQVSYLQ